MVNAPGDKSYPIAGTTWLLVYETQKDAAKGKKLVEFLKTIHNYANLSTKLKKPTCLLKILFVLLKKVQASYQA